MTKLTDKDLAVIAKESGLTFAFLKTFIEVEAAGTGFDPKTGKILIQFEPHLFKQNFKDWWKNAKIAVWETNKVEPQPQEWQAFNSAFAEDKEAAMLSTSIGLPQILGAHYKRLGYKSVGEMWDDFKAGEINQIRALVKFIKTDSRLLKAVIAKDWHLVATLYNGKYYKQLAQKLRVKPYDQRLKETHDKYEKMYL